MTTADLYDLADRRGHAVVFFDLPECESMCIDANGKTYIGIDPHLIGTEEKEHLAHELGHAEYGGFYNSYSAFDVVEKSERRADKWAIMRLCPLAAVRRCRNMTIWEMAERFDVSVRFIQSALAYYSDAGVLNL